MTAATANPGNTVSTFLDHDFRSGLKGDDRFVVERSCHVRGAPVWDPHIVIELAAGAERGPNDTEAEAAASLVFAKLARNQVGVVSDAPITGNDMDPQTYRESLGALEDELPPNAGRVIVQCVDAIDEVQRWLEGRE